MDSAFQLWRALPAPGPAVLPAIRSGLGARRTTDREIAICLKRVARQVMFREIILDMLFGPFDKRIHLDPPILRFKKLKFCPCRCLEALAAIDPAGESPE